MPLKHTCPGFGDNERINPFFRGYLKRYTTVANAEGSNQGPKPVLTGFSLNVQNLFSQCSNFNQLFLLDRRYKFWNRLKIQAKPLFPKKTRSFFYFGIKIRVFQLSSISTNLDMNFVLHQSFYSTVSLIFQYNNKQISIFNSSRSIFNGHKLPVIFSKQTRDQTFIFVEVSKKQTKNMTQNYVKGREGYLYLSLAYTTPAGKLL